MSAGSEESPSPKPDEFHEELHAEQADGSPDLEQVAKLVTIPLGAAKQAMRALMDSVLHINVTGTEHIPGDGGGILVCNHTDYMDVLVQGTHCPRKLVFLGKQELFEPDEDIRKFLFQEGSPLNLPGLNLARPLIDSVLGAYGAAYSAQLKEWGGHPVIRNYRGDSARAAVEYYQELEEYMVRLLRDGMFLSIFPEGTRTRTGLIGPFKAMAAKLAIRAQVPIVPSGIQGSWRMLTPEGLLSGRMFQTTIQYNIGQPLLPSDFPTGEEKKAAKELTAMLEKQVYALTVHPERRGHPRGRARQL